MSQSLRQIKSRILSIQNTQKIMRAMEMVSVSKMKKTEGPLRLARNYFSKLDQLFGRLVSLDENRVHPFFKKASSGAAGKNVLCLFSSDTGLCSTYNNRIFDVTQQFLEQQAQKNFHFIAVGKKGFNYLRKKGFPAASAYLDLYGRFSSELADKVSAEVQRLFSSEEIGEVYFAFTRYKSAMRLQPAVEKLISVPVSSSSAPLPAVDYIVEPNALRLWEVFFPEYIRAKVRMALLESFMSEHSARTVAMKQATDNAKELLEGLILLRNKIRQYSITKEVIEIISSAEALKG